jgi:FixJ family two-component response regulator
VVWILDDDPSVSRSLSRLLTVHGFQSRIFTDPAKLLSSPPAPQPACLILDLKLGPVDGIDLLSEFGHNGHDYPIVVLTAFGSVAAAVKAMRHGAEDFLEKPFEPEALLAAVSRALKRSRREAGARGKLSRLRTRAACLTPRERQVIEMVSQGMLNKEIANALGLAEITVKIHRGRAMRRIGAHNAVELVRLASLLRLGTSASS